MKRAAFAIVALVPLLALVGGCDEFSGSTDLDGPVIVQMEVEDVVSTFVSMEADRQIELRVSADEGYFSLELEDPAGTSRATWEVSDEWASPCDPQFPLTVSWISDRAGTWTLHVSRSARESETPSSLKLSIDPVGRGSPSPTDRERWDLVRSAEQARASMERDDFDGAKAVVDSIVIRNPSIDAALYWDNLADTIAMNGGAAPYELAATLVERALELRRTAEPPASTECIATTLSRLGGIHYNRGKYPAALQLDSESVKLLRSCCSTTAPEDVAAAYLNLGKSYFGYGKFAEAEESYREGRALLPSSADWDGRFDQAEAELRREQSRFDEALLLWEQALAKAIETGDCLLQWDVRNSLGGFAMDRGNLSEMAYWTQEARDTCPETLEQRCDSTVNALISEGTALRLQRNFSQARARFDEGRELAATLCDDGDPVATKALTEFARLEVEDPDGDVDRARVAIDEATHRILAARGATHPDAADARFDAGLLFRALGDPDRAAAEFREVIEIRTANYGTQSHHEVAQAQSELAWALLERNGTEDLAEIGRLSTQARVTLSALSAHPQSELESIWIQARLAYSESGAKKAIAQLLPAIEKIEQMRTIVGGGDRARSRAAVRFRGIYDDWVDWNAGERNIWPALEGVERARARGLLDRVSMDYGAILDDLSPADRSYVEERDRLLRETHNALLQKRQTLAISEGDDKQIEMTRLDKEIDQVLRELTDVTEDAYNRSPSWNAISQPISLSGWSDIRKASAENDLVLIYHIGKAQSWLFALRPTLKEAEVYPLSVSANLASRLGIAAGELTTTAIQKVVSKLVGSGEGSRGLKRVVPIERPSSALSRNPGTSEIDPELLGRLHELYNILVPEKLRPSMEHADSVLILPDRELAFLPFEALVVSPGQDGEPEYWLDTVRTTRYAPSISLLSSGTNEDRRIESRTVLSVVDPVFDTRSRRASLPRLPGTRKEGARIEEAIRASGVRVQFEQLAGDQATEAAVTERSQHAWILHFATHGLLAESGGQFSGLALTPGSDAGRLENNGIWQSFEIQQSPLAAELVVLSACDTRSGELLDGEGVVGMARAFFGAGAQRVVASSWKVDDEATAVLMGHYFDELVRQLNGDEPVSFSSAWHTAVRTTKADSRFRHPYYWSAFAFVGRP